MKRLSRGMTLGVLLLIAGMVLLHMPVSASDNVQVAGGNAANVSPACARSNITAYNASNNFSLVSNPNGCWSYGYENSLNTSLQLYDINTTNARGVVGLDSWTASSIGVDPHVVHNSLNNDTQFTSSVIIPANGLQFHPGPNGQFSVIRWTARAGGNYNLTVTFRGNDFVGTTTDVHVLHNGNQLFADNVTGFGGGTLNGIFIPPTLGCCTNFSTKVFVSRGDTIDFLVGVGADGTYDFDSTGIDASIMR